MGHSHSGDIRGVLALNIIITVVEYIGAFYSGSVALLADAGHNLTDVISLIIGYGGEKYSKLRPSEKHSFGFLRLEVFTALINAIFLWLIGLHILAESLNNIDKAHVDSLLVMGSVGFIGLAGNLISVLLLHKSRDESLNLRASYLHLLYDTISSVFVLLSALIIYVTGNQVVDRIVSIIIALMIFYSGFEVIKKSVHIFMQGVPEDIDPEKVKKNILDIYGVCEIHGLHIWALNSREIFLSTHVCLDDGIGKNPDEVIKEINKNLEEKHHIKHTTIQVESQKICSEGNGCCR